LITSLNGKIRKAGSTNETALPSLAAATAADSVATTAAGAQSLIINNNNTNTAASANSPIKSLIQNLPSEYYIYLCLNCRLFFTSNTTFSHNCWNINEIATGNNNKSTNKPNAPASSNSNNYFSPIYLKFNVSKLLISYNGATPTSSATNLTNDELGHTNQLSANKKLKLSNSNSVATNLAKLPTAHKEPSNL
jgi:hypothetical protein